MKKMNSKTKGSNVKSGLRPGQTKSSLQRQLLVQTKKLEATSLVPDEVLYHVFTYVSASDLLRCCLVSKLWLEVANIPTLWEKQFKRLPKRCKEISTKAKTWGNIDWKKECIYCAKEFRQMKVNKLLRNSNLDSVKKAKANATKTLRICWLIQLVDNHSNTFEIMSDEDFIFSNGISIRWNHLVCPPLTDICCLKVFALTPLFFDKDASPIKDSVHTRSLMVEYSRNKKKQFDAMKEVCSDDHVVLFKFEPLCLYIGLWKLSVPFPGDIAFVGLAFPLKHLLLKTQAGNSNKQYCLPAHQPILDDVDAKYGLHGYTAVVTLRNCRKVFFCDTFQEFKNGVEINGNFMIEQQRYTDYVFYDIKENLTFLWTTAAIKGKIEGTVIVEVELYDSNNELLWNISSLVKLQFKSAEQDNYSYENCEIWKLEHQDNNIRCSLELIKNTVTKESTVLSVKFLLEKHFVNKWFGTKH